MNDIVSEELNLTVANQMLREFQQLLDESPESEIELIKEDFLPVPLNLTQANQLIQDFKSLGLDSRPKRKKSFLEILNLERREVTNSRILAFFLNTKEAHGLNDLFLQALLNLADKNPPHHLSTLSVKMEISSGDQKGRIDLLVETPERVILIENKLFHHANNNPFDSYIGYIEQEFPQHDKTYILLGLEKPDSLPAKFIWVSHFDLAKKVRMEIGNHWSYAEQYYMPILLDYLNAIESLNPESEFGKMEQAIVDFYRNNHELLGKIEENIHHVHDYYKEQIVEIIEQIEIQQLKIFSVNTEFHIFEGGISDVGGYLYSTTLKSSNTDHILEFWIGKSTQSTILGLNRYVSSVNKKSHSETKIFLQQHDIKQFCEFEHDIYLLELPETVSAESFATQAAPIIQKLMEIHGITMDNLIEDSEDI